MFLFSLFLIVQVVVVVVAIFSYFESEMLFSRPRVSLFQHQKPQSPWWYQTGL
jgi:hypothetical protein